MQAFIHSQVDTDEVSVSEDSTFQWEGQVLLKPSKGTPMGRSIHVASPLICATTQEPGRQHYSSWAHLSVSTTSGWSLLEVKPLPVGMEKKWGPAIHLVLEGTP